MRKALTFGIIILLATLVLSGTSLAAISDSEFKSHLKDLGLGEKRVIIVYKDHIKDKDITDLQKRGAKLRHKYKTINAISAFIDKDDEKTLKLDNNIAAVFEDKRVNIFLSDSVPQINADQVHSAGGTGSGVRVCIIDSGIEDSHSDLNPVVYWEDIVNGLISPYDDHGHGTHVAGIIASQDIIYKGVAPGSSIMSIKSMDSSGGGWTSDIIAGIDSCVLNDADVISMSLGEGAYTNNCDSEPLTQAANNAVNQGVTVLAATGNDGYINALSSPSCGSKVLAIGAVDKSDERTPYSNEGIELDFVAPGTNIISTYIGNSFATKLGTSMATPHASGTVALILEQNPSLTPEQVKTILQETSLDLGAAGFDTIYGFGRIDAYEAYQYSSTLTPPDPVAYQQILFDDFNDGAVGSWDVNNAQEDNECGQQSSPYALHFTGAGNRQASTQSLDVSKGGKVTFYLMFGTQSSSSGCENADNREDVVLEYSTNSGSSWTLINTYDTEAFTSFTLIQEDIPTEAETTSTMFRWRQVRHSGGNWDNWAIDDVLIEIVEPEPTCTEDSDCNDDLFCNGVESCVSGACQTGSIPDCSASGDQCNTGVCDETTDSCIAQPVEDGTSCNDGEFCNVNEACQSGICTGGSSRDCASGNQCLIGSCDETTDSCVTQSVEDGTSCDDGEFCTQNTFCDTGVCGNGDERDCSDDVFCTTDTCNEASNSCENTPDNSACDNGLFCDGVETCNINLDCQSGDPVTCEDNDECTTNTCNEEINACEFTDIPQCSVEIKCWDGSNEYLRRWSNQMRKFCKCAAGVYDYEGHSRISGRENAYQYIDTGNNENWEVSLRTNYRRPVYQVECADNEIYPTNVDYFTS
jgi:minor extracellular protease Epr